MSARAKRPGRPRAGVSAGAERWEEHLARLKGLADVLDKAALADPERDPPAWAASVEAAWRELAWALSGGAMRLALLGPGEALPWGRADTVPGSAMTLSDHLLMAGTGMILRGGGATHFVPDCPPLCELALSQGSASGEVAEVLVELAIVRARCIASWVRTRCQAVFTALLPSLREVEPDVFELTDAGRVERVALGAESEFLRLVAAGSDAGGDNDNAMKQRRRRLLRKLGCLRPHLHSRNGKYVMSEPMRASVSFLR